MDGNNGTAAQLPAVLKNSNAPSVIDWGNAVIKETLKKTVAQGASDEEFVMFAELCKSSGLNPFKKEVWFIKTNGRVQMMTGINGYLTIANRHAQFDGMEMDNLYDGDRLVASICRVYRKDRRLPSIGKALMVEFKQATPIWNSKPHVMLDKVAKSIAIREAFPQETNGMYTEEEMPPKFSAPTVVASSGEDEARDEYRYKFPIGTESDNRKLKAKLESGGAKVEGLFVISPKKIRGLVPAPYDADVDADVDEAPAWESDDD